MTQNELLDLLEKWAAAQDLHAVADHETSSVRFHFRGNTGEWLCTGICEEGPLVVQALCRLPVRVPAERRPEAGLVLHRLNARIRIGSYSLDAQDGEVTFRVPMPIWPEAPIEDQIKVAFATACATVDHHLGLLCLCFFDQADVRQKRDAIQPGNAVDNCWRRTLPRGRAGLN
jgi:hypothetical protein